MRASPLMILTLVLSSSPALVAADLTTSHLASDLELLDIMPTPSYVAEGRIGDRGGAATFELDLGHNTAAPDVTAHYDWQSSVGESFSLSYDGVGQVTFSLGGQTLEYTPLLLDMTDIFIRTRATQEGSEILVTDLVLDGEVVMDQSYATPPPGLDILRIEGGTLTDGYLLTGTATLTWTGDPPRNSHLAFQIKVGEPEGQVPVGQATWGRIKELFR